MSALSVDVLIIDDSAVDLRLLMQMMSVQDLTFSVAQNARRGLEQAKEMLPGLILLDVRMPDMDGYTLCRLLKSEPLTRHIPVIFLTAASDLQERLSGFLAGGVDYISKPFAPEEVLARVGVHLALADRRLSEFIASDEPRSESLVPKSALLVAAAQKELRQRMRNRRRWMSWLRCLAPIGVDSVRRSRNSAAGRCSIGFAKSVGVGRMTSWRARRRRCRRSAT